MKQDSLGQDGNDCLNARQLQKVVLEEKGSVCRIFTSLPVAAKPSPVDDLHLHNTGSGALLPSTWAS